MMFRLLMALRAEARSERPLAKAHRDRDLADIYIGSGQLDVEMEDPAFEALLDVRTNLPQAARRAVEAKAGIVQD